MTSSNEQDCDCAPAYHESGVHAPGYRPPPFDTHVPLGAYQVEDLASMSPSAARLLLHRAAVESEVEVETHRHLVISRDTETEVVTYADLFPTGLEALTVAQSFVERIRSVDPHRQFTLAVVPLLAN